MARIDAIGTCCSRLTVELLAFFASSYKAAEGFPAPPVHDACAVAYVIDPAVMTVEDAFVAVETAGRWTSGMTVVDFDGRLGRQANAKVATRLDAVRLWSMVTAALERPE